MHDLSMLLIHIFRTDTEPKQNTEGGTLSIDETIERAKRAFALKKYEEAVEHYATALEQV